ncbi:hypothetical protein [Streptomyces sp. NPDC058657]|uniref:hypothetical protein n=1 Tax=unclassified Streptomyces TaxID=2593676 RepID=UPI0036528DD5
MDEDELREEHLRQEHPRQERVRDELHRAAASHRPDRARILARVERGMAAGAGAPGESSARGRKGVRTSPLRLSGVRARAASWPRVAGATAACAAVLIAGGYGVVGILHKDSKVRTATTPVPTPTGTDAARPTGLPSTPGPALSTPPSPPRTPARTPERDGGTAGTKPPAGTAPPAVPASPPAPGALRTQDGHLWGDGSVDPHSNDFWAQSNLTFKTAEPLTALTLELRIAGTEGVRDAGSWISLDPADFDISVRRETGALVYRWTLKPGRTVPAGEHRAAGQYHHAKGNRDAGGDRYSVTTTAADGRKATVGGDFYPVR